MPLFVIAIIGVIPLLLVAKYVAVLSSGFTARLDRTCFPPSSLRCCPDKNGKKDRYGLVGTSCHGHSEMTLILVLERRRANGNTLLVPKQDVLAVWCEKKYNAFGSRKIYQGGNG